MSKPYLCKICLESDPSKFDKTRGKSTCKKCHNQNNKSARIKYEQTHKGKQARNKAVSTYRQTLKYKEITRIYTHSEQGIIIRRKISRRFYQAHKEEEFARVSKRRAKKKGNGGSHTANEWKLLKETYYNKCAFCGCDTCKLTKDHIIPISKGGTDYIINIQPLCLLCNLRKHTKTIKY